MISTRNIPVIFSRRMIVIAVLMASAIQISWASNDSSSHYAIPFLWIAIALLASKIGGLVEKFGQPAVLGELLIGVILGNISLLGVAIFEPMKTNEYLHFLAEIGVVVLLFQVGLESNVHQMRKVGIKSLLVATVGVVFPFLLGRFVAGPLLMPGLSDNAYLFLGATLTATSVGITARVFKDFSILHSKEAQIVLGAAVIDDIMGLVILAIVTSVVQSGDITVLQLLQTIGMSLAFLGGGTIIGMYTAPIIGKWLSKISAGSGMKLAFALSIGFLFAYLSHAIGLAPIVGAFTAGLFLDSVHFKHFDSPSYIEEYTSAVQEASSSIQEKVHHVSMNLQKKHIEEILEPIGQFLAPIFFIITGLAVDISVFANPQIVYTALGLSLFAILGKLVSGFIAGSQTRHWVIGWGMVPRGEVGLIFASVGRALGVVGATEYSVIVVVIMITTLITPPMLAILLRKK